MTDSWTVIGSLVLLGLCYPALLTTWWLLFPERVEKARLRINEKTRRCLGIGALAGLGAAIPAVLFFSIQTPFTQVLGWLWLAVVLGLSSLGAASIASELGLRVNWKVSGAHLSWGAFLRGALIWELASMVPLIGWLLVIPAGTLIALGGVMGTLREGQPTAENS